MSPAEWGLVVAVVSLLVGIGALGYARRAAKVSEEELEVAREQATLRPKLVVSRRDVVPHHRPENPGSPLVQAAVVFNGTNEGRSAAHNVRCEVRLDERHLVLDDMHGVNSAFFAERIGPEDTKVLQRNVGILVHGPTEASYTCWCDEVGKSEGRVALEVPEWKSEDR
jgi:hypothetical protein